MAKVLALDIETSPLLTYTWGLYEQDVIKKLRPFTILSVAYQWLGSKTEVISCEKESEKSLLTKLHKLMDEADVIIAHNGDSFDIKKINARFIVHKFNPPSPYKTIDTKKEAKRVACFDSNSLENLGVDLSEGEKIKHRGFAMWEGCMAGNARDWADMRKYNKKDVDLLVKIYLRLRGWMKHHPELTFENGKCPSCLSSHVISRGIRILRNGRKKRLQCQSCGNWFQRGIKSGA